jgi:hypothetical protein
VRAEVDCGDEHAPVRVRHRRLDAAEQSRADRDRSTRQRSRVVAVQPDARSPHPATHLAVPSDHEAGLSRADHAASHDDRRCLEVVVADVVRRHLVVPQQAARARVEHEQRIRVSNGTGERAPVGQLGCAAPWRRVRVAAVEPSLRVDRDRIPQPAAAGLPRKAPGTLDRDELPAHAAGRGVECVDRSATRRRIADRAEVHEALPQNRGHVDQLLAAAREMQPPQLAPRLGVEGERFGVRRSVDAVVDDREPVRAVVERVVAPRPAKRSGRAVQREDVAAQVLGVNRVRVDDRGRREDAREARLCVEVEPPAHVQTRHVSGVDPRARGRACSLEIAVRERPDCCRAPSAAGQKPRSRGRRNDPCLERRQRSLLP